MDDAQFSDGWHTWAHYTPNPCPQECRAEVITLHHQTHQKGSTGTQPEHTVLVSQLKPAAHVKISKPVFWRLHVRDNAMKIFWSRYHCESLIKTLSLHTGLSFHTTLIKSYYFHPFEDQELQNLLSCQHPLWWSWISCLTAPIWLKWPETLWKDEVPPILHYWIYYQIYWSPQAILKDRWFYKVKSGSSLATEDLTQWPESNRFHFQ